MVINPDIKMRNEQTDAKIGREMKKSNILLLLPLLLRLCRFAAFYIYRHLIEEVLRTGQDYFVVGRHTLDHGIFTVCRLAEFYGNLMCRPLTIFLFSYENEVLSRQLCN